MDQRNRNTALVLIAAGLFILIEHYVSFHTTAALIFVLLGLYKIRTAPNKSGYVILGIGVVLFFSSHMAFILSIILISLGWFYMNSKRAHNGEGYYQKHTLIENIKWNKESWELKNASLWNLIGEVYIDLSLAVPEQKETTLLVQGVLGDVDIIVPEDLGVSVHASVLMGRVEAAREKDTGVLNKVVWQSPNYEASDTKVKLIVSYLVGDIDIKLV
ncbi:cell wall-active antibiotics response protein LiaF [Paenibacillus koleovorans]|uniref:cell wall-active antibiotics response protein LiaF n=1 Tax=Paenibacillus koleovorans TaxID=121608 RepID=UPI000FD9DD30|nr:cell wall-active antibiotics response protein LiaF [Paenibacillus koleovorans]